MRTISNTFSAAGAWQNAIPGRYFRLLGSSTPVDVNLYQRGVIVYQAEQVDVGFWTVPEGGFDRFEVVSAGAQTVKVAVSNGQGGYDATNITSTVMLASTITDKTPVTVGTVATLLASANSARKGLRLYNGGTADVYLGGSGVTTANGVLKLTPGSTYLEQEAAPAAWYGISGTAGQSVRAQEVI